jgi:ElaB/YqjD/DUF883 family membrane-anchored ribosome-binding protein
MAKERTHLEDLSKHTSEFRQKAANLGHDVQDLGTLTKEVARDAAGVLGENASGYYREGMKTAQKWGEGLEERIRQKPVQSLLIAAGVGLLIGAVLKRR